MKIVLSKNESIMFMEMLVSLQNKSEIVIEDGIRGSVTFNFLIGKNGFITNKELKKLFNEENKVDCTTYFIKKSMMWFGISFEEQTRKINAKTYRGILL